MRYLNSCHSRFSGVHLVLRHFRKGNECKEMLAISYLILQACISFLICFKQTWRISDFALFANKHAVAHVCPDPINVMASLRPGDGCVHGFSACGRTGAMS